MFLHFVSSLTPATKKARKIGWRSAKLILCPGSGPLRIQSFLISYSLRLHSSEMSNALSRSVTVFFSCWITTLIYYCSTCTTEKNFHGYLRYVKLFTHLQSMKLLGNYKESNYNRYILFTVQIKYKCPVYKIAL